MNIAVIGVAAIVEEYALKYACAGHEVSIALIDAPAEITRKRLAAVNRITVCTIEAAAADADMIIIASMPKDIREIAYWLGDVRKKVVIDCSANLLSVADDLLNTVMAIKAITGGEHIIKVFSTRGYEQLLRPLFGHSDVQLMMAGDSKKAKELAKILTLDLGVDKFIDLGGDQSLTMFNEMVRSWKSASLCCTENKAWAEIRR